KTATVCPANVVTRIMDAIVCAFSARLCQRSAQLGRLQTENHRKERGPARPPFAASLAQGPEPPARLETDVLDAGRHGEPLQHGTGGRGDFDELPELGAAARQPQPARRIEGCSL